MNGASNIMARLSFLNNDDASRPNERNAEHAEWLYL
jgi:hypothetical protein